MMEMDMLERAAGALGNATKVALACHVNPDPDALGSMLGLSAYLRARGVTTTCSYGNEPFEVARWAGMLPGSHELVPPADFPRTPDVLVTLDCASFDRLGNLTGHANRAGTVIWIDHHVSNEGLGTIPVIDPRASSTAEIVYRLTVRMGGDLPAEAAECLYAGIITDTGRFQYEATTPETLRVAAELRTREFDHAALARGLFEDNSLGYLRVLETALQRVELVEDVGLIWTYVTQADLTEAGVPAGETDELIDVIRTAREADVAAVLKQQRDGRFKVSMRSRGEVDVAGISAAHGGGGHRLAAGFTSHAGLADAVRDIVEGVRQGRRAGDSPEEEPARLAPAT
jgi:phosphoesterase RecJ-like protein